MARTRRRLNPERLENRQLLASVLLGPVATSPTLDTVAAVYAEEAPNLRAAEIRFQYDPEVLQIQTQDIHAGDIWNDKASVLANVDESAGIVTAFVFSVEPINNSQGDLININLHSAQTNACLFAPTIDLQEVRLNEGEITLNNPPVVGPDATDGFAARSSSETSPRRRRFDESFIGPIHPEHVDSIMHDLRPTVSHRHPF
ncbi:hypothetical protein FHS27_000119 [Rhodopirellula rubra]|uniref:Cohesin domain-containing protein n=1 Tax=Aporhodopirellula rubra TaxID=980271 RepID=A0A7W5H3Y0_9BACT|nr:cohesin domain-containing protein [Aporhodopirellula rubra]MBB3204355.1 hypothetical protein [Aporhodopirellula rubra]